MFGASVNSLEFLTDSTGNRRFLVIECLKINAFHNINMQQLWAEIYESIYLFDKTGYKLNREELNILNSYNKQYEQICPHQESVLLNYDINAPFKNRLMTASEIYFEVYSHYPNKSQVNKFAIALRGCGFKIANAGKKQYGMPEKKYRGKN